MFYNNINKALFKLIVVGLLASFLTACSLPQVKPTDALEPNKGLVIVRIVSNTYLKPWLRLTIGTPIEKISKKTQTFDLFPVSTSSMNSTQLFVDQLPEGTYELISLYTAEQVGNSVHSTRASIYHLGKFKVVSGHITNLGTIVYQQLRGGSYQVIHAKIDAEARELIANNYPVINNNAAGKGMIGWNDESTMANQSSKLLPFAKKLSTRFNNPKQISTGEIFAGSKLGQVLVKERDGKWTQLDTGCTREITAVLPIDRNTFYAGGEEGLLLVTNDGGKSWKRIKTPLKTSIFFLEQVNGRFFIGSRIWSNYLSDRTDLFYETGDIHSNNWKIIEAIKPILVFKSYPEFTSHVANNKLYLFIPGNIIYVLDLTTNSWSVINTPFDYSSINSLKNGLFYAKDGNTIHVSHDFGNSWTIAYGTYGTLYSPVFKDNKNAFVLRINPINQNVTLRKTQDGGKNWEEVNDFNDLKLPRPEKLFYDYINNKLYLEVGGLIFIASDDLKDWTMVR